MPQLNIRDGMNIPPIMDLMYLPFQRFPVATVIPMEVTTTLASTVAGGILLSIRQRAHGTDILIAVAAAYTATPSLRKVGLVCVALRIRLLCDFRF